jgi:hypothetical protein
MCTTVQSTGKSVFNKGRRPLRVVYGVNITALASWEKPVPRGHLIIIRAIIVRESYSSVGTSSDTLGSVDAHGFTTTTRRRSTSAAFPALSDTTYEITYGASDGVTLAVLTAATP